MHQPNFAMGNELLEISRKHREAVDQSRVYDNKVIGRDNWENLSVSTVFAAMAIEAALNDYVLSHCLLLDVPYVQEVFGEITKNYLRTSIVNKIKLLVDNWPDKIPADTLAGVRRLIEIRNRIAHQTGEFTTANKAPGGNAEMQCHRLTAEEMWHMVDHYKIAHDFLSRFWIPGTREAAQGRKASPPPE
jgi:hypothetical protein